MKSWVWKFSGIFAQVTLVFLLFFNHSKLVPALGSLDLLFPGLKCFTPSSPLIPLLIRTAPSAMPTRRSSKVKLNVVSDDNRSHTRHQFPEKAVWQEPIWVCQTIALGVCLHQWAMLQQVRLCTPYRGKEKKAAQVVWELPRRKSLLPHRSQ